jgi:hypothetical protein
MANQSYKLITHPVLKVGDRAYVVEAYHLELGEFLDKNAGKQIWILEKSLLAGPIRAIVI